VGTIEKYTEWTGNKMYSHNKEDLNNFFLLFNAAKGTFPLSELNAKLAKRAKLNEAKRKREQKEQIKKQELNLALWLQGVQLKWTQPIDKIEKVYLRVDVLDDPEMVETSKGARISLKAAKVLFDLIHAGKDVKGFEIDGYTVISMKGVLTIGFHKIERSEIERFAKTQNWI